MDPTSTPPQQPSMILFMGATGAGKSYMINQAAGLKIAEEGPTLDSCTQSCQLVPAQLGHTRVLLIDTPGFDDSRRDDSEILGEIAQVLSAQYELGMKLKGVIFVHSITDIRYTGSSARTFEIFRKICGEKALQNVLLVTSRWSEVDQRLGSERERQLRQKFWAYMLNNGSNMSRFHGDRDSAIALVSQLLCKSNVVLELQTELSEEGKTLDETVAGSFVCDRLRRLMVEYKEELAALERVNQSSAENGGTMEQQVQIDWNDTLARLTRAANHQISLRRAVAHDVREDISRKRSMFHHVLSVVGIFAEFVGVSPDFIDTIHSWIHG